MAGELRPACSVWWQSTGGVVSLVAVNLHRQGSRRRLLGIALTVLLGATLLVVLPATAAAADPGGSGGNPVACENTLPGTPSSTWDVSGSGSTTIQGFATQMSVNVSETVHFKVKTPARSYTCLLYTSDAADEEDSVDLGGRRIIKKKKKKK